MRPLMMLLPALLAGCISVSSTKAPSDAPDYTAFCKEKELLCHNMCGSAGVQTFSCKATASDGLDYQCQCKKPAAAP